MRAKEDEISCVQYFPVVTLIFMNSCTVICNLDIDEAVWVNSCYLPIHNDYGIHRFIPAQVSEN